MNESSATTQTAALRSASEEDLARRVQVGCADSFAELVDRLQPRLLFVLRRRMQHYADAEDVAQKTLLRAFEKIDLYDATRKFSPWLFTIALRLAADHHRQRKIPVALAGEAAVTAVDPNPNPEQLAIHGEQSRNIWEVAQHVLQPESWTALWLLYGEGQSVREIARSLGRTAVSVRVLLFRARKTLTPHLAKFADDLPGKTEHAEEDGKESVDYTAPSIPQIVKAES